MNAPLRLTVMMYHYIRDPGDEAEAGSGIAGMPVHTFEAQINALSQEHTFVTWQDVRMALQAQQPLPEAACLLTFDDGIRDHYIHVFKILRARNLSGLFFVMDRSDDPNLILAHKIHFLLAKLGLPGLRDALWERLSPVQRDEFLRAQQHYEARYPGTSPESRVDLLKAILQRDLSLNANPLLSDLFETHIGSEQQIAKTYYLNPDQIGEMRAGGMYFGGHSHNHPWFDWISADTRESEIEASARWLRQFDPGPWAFAYPYGGLADDSPALLSKHGFMAAFTTREQLQHSDPYYIGRLDGEELALGANRYG